jgi:hypothetical protein
VILNRHILIFDITEDKKIIPPVKNIRSVTCWNGKFDAFGGAKPTINCDYMAGVLWLPIAWDWWQFRPNMHDKTSFLHERWATPIINESIFDEAFDFFVNSDWSSHTGYFELVREHMRPIGISGPFSGIGGNPGGFGKAHREQAKDGSKHCYDDGRHRRNDGIVLINGPPNATELNQTAINERHESMGRTFSCCVGLPWLPASALHFWYADDSYIANPDNQNATRNSDRTIIVLSSIP